MVNKLDGNNKGRVIELASRRPVVVPFRDHKCNVIGEDVRRKAADVLELGGLSYDRNLDLWVEGLSDLNQKLFRELVKFYNDAVRKSEPEKPPMDDYLNRVLAGISLAEQIGNQPVLDVDSGGNVDLEGSFFDLRSYCDWDKLYKTFKERGCGLMPMMGCSLEKPFFGFMRGIVKMGDTLSVSVDGFSALEFGEGIINFKKTRYQFGLDSTISSTDKRGVISPNVIIFLPPAFKHPGEKKSLPKAA